MLWMVRIRAAPSGLPQEHDEIPPSGAEALHVDQGESLRGLSPAATCTVTIWLKPYPDTNHSLSKQPHTIGIVFS
jgi:hypothetical protein